MHILYLQHVHLQGGASQVTNAVIGFVRTHESPLSEATERQH